MDKLLETKQMPQEKIKDFIERFRNISLLCPAGMPISMLLHTCKHNFLNRVENRMGAVKAHTWKELVGQAEQAEMTANKCDPPAQKPKWGTDNQNRNPARNSQSKGKDTLAVEIEGETSQTPKKTNPGSSSGPKFPPKQYSFRDDQVVTLFHLLNKSNRLKLPDATRPEEVGRTNEPIYCLYHRMLHHPTS
jgi:hypothetical protein